MKIVSDISFAPKMKGEIQSPVKAYAHPTTIDEFVEVYKKEYKGELDNCDRWIKWCKNQTPRDDYGVNFYKGMRSAHVFNNIKMGQLIRILKQEYPNCKKK